MKKDEIGCFKCFFQSMFSHFVFGFEKLKSIKIETTEVTLLYSIHVVSYGLSISGITITQEIVKMQEIKLT